MSEQQHTFGGSPLDRYVYEFETPDPGGTGDPGIGEPAPAEPAAEPAWTGPSQDEWGSVMTYVQAQQQREAQIAQMYGAPGTQQPEAPDLYDDPDAWLEHKLSQRLAPVEQFQREVSMEEANERAMDILGDLASRDGDFNKQIARLRAEELLPKFQQQYGNTPQAAEAALAAGAHQQREYEAEERKRYVDEHTNHIATLAGAPGDPGSTFVQGTQQRTMPNYREGGRVTDRFFGPHREA